MSIILRACDFLTKVGGVLCSTICNRQTNIFDFFFHIQNKSTKLNCFSFFSIKFSITLLLCPLHHSLLLIYLFSYNHFQQLFIVLNINFLKISLPSQINLLSAYQTFPLQLNIFSASPFQTCAFISHRNITLCNLFLFFMKGRAYYFIF